jgi:transcriptional regulator with XRE-family HTH domain
MTQSYAGEPSAAAAILQLARLKAGISQQALAERASVPTTMISAYERDKRQPTLTTLLRLLHAAGFDLRLRLEPYVLADQDIEPLDKEQADRWRLATPLTAAS